MLYWRSFRATDASTPRRELFFPEDLDEGTLRQILGQAGIRSNANSDGLTLQGEFKVHVIPDRRRSELRFTALFISRAQSRKAERAFVARVNAALPLLRAAARDRTPELELDFTLVTAGGVTRDQIVGAAQEFVVCLAKLGDFDDDGVL
jgi:hypothetical protein